MEEEAGDPQTGVWGHHRSPGGWSGVGDGGQEAPGAGALDPRFPQAVLTEAGQPCSFPFRYGGRMLHSCTTEGGAHRKWWVQVPAPPSPPWRPSHPLPSQLRPEPGMQQVE